VGEATALESSRAGRRIIERPRLTRLLTESESRVMLLVAPAGYGKTTVLAEWAEQDPRPFAWLPLEREDDDPVRLLASIAFALDEIEPVGRALCAALAARPALQLPAVAPVVPVRAAVALRRDLGAPRNSARSAKVPA